MPDGGAAARSRRVLVVEDEQALRDLVSRTLQFAGFDVVAAADVAAAREAFTGDLVEVAVLDVMLPDGSGLDLAQELRAARPGTGVLFLTARDSLEDRLTGFAMGADDYLTKPFSVAELVARVTALHRRSLHQDAEPEAEHEPAPVPVPPPASVLAVGDVTIDDDAHTVHRAGQPLDLSPTEYKLLLLLLENAGRVLSKEQILARVWEYDFVGDVGVVEKFVSQLRRKLAVADGEVIETVRGFGYTVRRSHG